MRLTMDAAYTLSGFVVGAIVGLTGVGGGSLMTPLGNIPAPIRSHRTLLAGFLLLFPGVVSDVIALGMLLFGRDELPRFAPQHVHVRGSKSSRIYEGQFRRHD